MKVSVILATCDRCNRLRLLLDSFNACSVGNVPETEVLVIDNNSSDATRQVVSEYSSLQWPVFRYLLEKRPGKSRALNTGIREAKGEILAFTDDDCIPDPSWIQAIAKEFDADPELSVLGGRVELYDQEDLPQAIVTSKSRVLVRNVRQVCQDPAIIGANMAFRKAVFTLSQGFDPLLGPGSACKAAEDIDLLYRSLQRRLKIAYSPEVLMFHNHGRKTQFQDDETSLAYAIGRGALYFKHIRRSDIRMFGIAVKELSGLLQTLAIGVIKRKHFPYHRQVLPALFLGALYYAKACFSSTPIRQSRT